MTTTTHKKKWMDAHNEELHREGEVCYGPGVWIVVAEMDR